MSACRIAIVVARFNIDITEKLLEGARSCLLEHEIDWQDKDVVWVAGAVEVPLIAQQLALSGQYDAVITFGCVIKGETDHYEYVCQHVTYGCQRVSLTTNVPVIFGVLTTPTRELAMDRVGGKSGHYGIDSAKTAIEMVQLMRKLRSA